MQRKPGFPVANCNIKMVTIIFMQTEVKTLEYIQINLTKHSFDRNFSYIFFMVQAHATAF